MNIKSIIMMMCGVILVGCSPTNQQDADVASKDASETLNDNYQDAKETAKMAAGVVKDQAVEAGTHVVNVDASAREGSYQAMDHVADWMKPSKPKPPQSIASSYCYHVYQDTLCYRQPMPGWEGRLAGYQPLTADPPPLAIMQPMPKHALDNSQLPVNRVASSKPVFSQLPTQGAATEKAPEDATTPGAAAAASDATHEQLPDPAMAPQL